jgi:hypothetical protein
MLKLRRWHCKPSRRTRSAPDIDLQLIELKGLGGRPLARLKDYCAHCGGEMQVRPPAPQISDGKRAHLFARDARAAP